MPIKRIRLRTAPYPFPGGDMPRFSIYPVVWVQSHRPFGGSQRAFYAVYGNRDGASGAAPRSSAIGSLPVPYSPGKSGMWLTGNTLEQPGYATSPTSSFADWSRGVYGYLERSDGCYLTAMKEGGLLQRRLELAPSDPWFYGVRAADGRLAVAFGSRAVRLELGDSGYTITDTITSYSFLSPSIMADFSGVYVTQNATATTIDVRRYLFDGSTSVVTVPWPASITGAFTGSITGAGLWRSGGASGWDMLDIYTSDDQYGFAGIRVTEDDVQFSPAMLLQPGDDFYMLGYAYSLHLHDSRTGEYRAFGVNDGFYTITADKYVELKVDGSGVVRDASPFVVLMIPDVTHVFGNGKYCALYAYGLVVVVDATTGEPIDLSDTFGVPQGVVEIAPGRWVIGDVYFDGSSLMVL